MTFDLFTARSILLHYAFVWAPYICMGKMLRISNDFSSEAPVGKCCSNFMWSLLSLGNEILLKWLQSIDQGGCTTDLYTFSFVSSLIPLWSQILPRSRPNAALALAILALTSSSMCTTRQCASKVGELVYHLQSLTFHCDGRLLVRLSRCWLIYYLSLFDADCEIIAVT